MSRRVVVTGLGAVTPIGNNVDDFWTSVKAGKIGFDHITKFDTTDYKCHIAAELKDFNPQDFMDRKAAKRMEPFSQYAVAAAKQAIDDSRLDIEKEDPYMVGCAIGSGIGSLQAMERETQKLYEKGPNRVNPLLVPLMICNMAAGNVSIQFGLKGKSINDVTACATGTNTIRADEDSIAHELYRILRDCDELDVDVIFSESFSTPRIGQAIMNRMLKAAGHQVIDTHVKYDKIIFVAQTGTCREQMAKGIMNDFVLKVPMEIEARGLVVQFPEPVNQKAEAVLISNGISTEGMVSTQLEESDITESTMVFTMESSQRERIIESFADIDPEQVFVLSQYVGDELEILDPYGGTLQSYGLCYESLRATLKKLVKRLNANT